MEPYTNNITLLTYYWQFLRQQVSTGLLDLQASISAGCSAYKWRKMTNIHLHYTCSIQTSFHLNSLLVCILPSGYPTRNLHAFLLSPIHATCPPITSSLIWYTRYYLVRSVTRGAPDYALFSSYPLLPFSAQIPSAASYSRTLSAYILLLILKEFIRCFYIVILSYILLKGHEHTPSETNLLTGTWRCTWQQFMSYAKQFWPGMLSWTICW
jgi:hypothetical protein